MLVEMHDVAIAYFAMGLAHAAANIFDLDADYEATVPERMRKQFPLWGFQLFFAVVIFLLWPFILSSSITLKMTEVKK